MLVLALVLLKLHWSDVLHILASLAHLAWCTV